MKTDRPKRRKVILLIAALVAIVVAVSSALVTGAKAVIGCKLQLALYGAILWDCINIPAEKGNEA